MSYVLDNYVEAGYVVPYSITVTGVYKSISISPVNILNVPPSIASPLGVSVHLIPNAIPHVSSTAFPLGSSITTEFGSSYVTVRSPGMHIRFIEETGPSYQPIVGHNNSGELVAGPITEFIQPEVLPTNYGGGVGEITATPAYFKEAPSYIYGLNVDQLWAYEVTTFPGNREINFGIISSDKYLEIIIYNKRVDNITFISSDIPASFGCELSGLFPGQTISSLSQVSLRITAKLLKGEANVADFFSIIFDKVTIKIFVTVYRQPIVVYSLYPNRDTYNETYIYKTGVFEATSKKEKRVAMMEKAKRTVSYKVTPTTGSDATFLENTVYSGIYDIMYQPMWAFMTRSKSTVISGTEILCDTYSNIFFAGEYVGLYVDEYTVILNRLTGVENDRIFVSQEMTLYEGSYILPLFIGSPETFSGSYTGTTKQSFSIKIKEL